MSLDLYDVRDVVDKTLTAKIDIPVCDSYPTTGYTPKQIGIVRAGFPAGIVFSWINADPGEGRSTLWWMFYPATTYGDYYFIPHNKGWFDVANLREQGVITIEEEREQEEESNKPWYEKLSDKLLPIIVITVLGAAAIRGYFSNRKQ